VRLKVENKPTTYIYLTLLRAYNAKGILFTRLQVSNH